MSNEKNHHMPRAVSRRIMERCARNEVVVVVPRRGKPGKVYSLENYQKMQEQPRKHQPWKHRRGKAATVDPLGAVEMGRILLPLTRENMYE